MRDSRFFDKNGKLKDTYALPNTDVEFLKQLYKNFENQGLEDLSDETIIGIATRAWNTITCHNKPIKIDIFNTTDVLSHRDSGTTLAIASPAYPFTTDSILSTLEAHGCNIDYILYSKNRSADFSFTGERAVTYIQLSHILPFQNISDLEEDLLTVFKELELAVNDYENILKNIDALIKDIPLSEWLKKNNFKVLGLYSPNNALGILRKEEYSSYFKAEMDDIPFLGLPYGSLIGNRAPLIAINIAENTFIVGNFTQNGQRTLSQLEYYKSVYNDLVNTLSTERFLNQEQEIPSLISAIPERAFLTYTRTELLKCLAASLRVPQREKSVTFYCKKPDLLEVIIFLDKNAFSSKMEATFLELIRKEVAVNNVWGGVETTTAKKVCFYYVIEPRTLPSSSTLHKLSDKIDELSHSWEDKFINLSKNKLGLMESQYITSRYLSAFSDAYKTANQPEVALEEALLLEKFIEAPDQKIEANIVSSINGALPRLRLFHKHEVPPISKMYPLLQSLGFQIESEISYKIGLKKNRTPLYVQDIAISLINCDTAQLSQHKVIVEEAIKNLSSQRMPLDRLNALTALIGLTAKEINLLRGLVKYSKQIKFNLSRDTLYTKIISNPACCLLLIKLFHAKFTPADAKHNLENLKTDLANKIDELEDTDTSRVYELLLNLIDACVRTNYYLNKDYLSLKFESKKINILPQPRPFAEIFVFSSLVEGIHLRFGPISRGGIRWSDRADDYRQEILDLVKAQNVKNAVIVPEGSKGGFYIHSDIPSKEVVLSGYKQFIAGLLEVTDNLKPDGTIVKPKNVKAYDEPDPYLVVAADKGTAAFSDTANELALKYGYWLEDAFASGGSHGYDHKKLAITSRGAWESAKRHLREVLQKDPAKDEFSVIGVGDMSGDVFGNGMLLSDKSLLKGAFNHLHIFIDPSPNAASSYSERKRLFSLKQSSWEDYDRNILSKGGMIIKRSQKIVELTPEAQKFLEAPKPKLTPNEIIRLLLKAPTDLIWLGGIGTYFKSSIESHLDVADKSNDDVRINGRDIRAAIIVEGANLGMTQAARIEYALHGGRLNTDALDNSAGVDCSDHEVNIKILLSQAVKTKEISLEDRNKLLNQVEQDVTRLVLKNNFAQNLAISISEVESFSLIDEHLAIISRLRTEGILDPSFENFPTEEEIERRKEKGVGLSRPELCLLNLYVKNYFFKKIIANVAFEDEFFSKWLEEYFPGKINGQFNQFISNHPLKKEIIATELVNEIVNNLGIHFLFRTLYQTGKPFRSIIHSYILTREIFNMPSYWEKLNEIDNTSVNNKDYLGLALRYRQLFSRACLWTLTHLPHNVKTIKESLEFFQGPFKKLFHNYQLAGAVLEAINEHPYPKINKELTKKLKSYRISTMPFIKNHNTAEGLKTFHKVGEIFGFSWLLRGFDLNKNLSYWQKVFTEGIRLELYDAQGLLTDMIMAHMKEHCKSFDQALESFKEDIELLNQLMTEIKVKHDKDLWSLAVLTRHLRLLTRRLYDR